MVMQMVQQSQSEDGPLGWFTFERRNWLAMVAAACVLGFSIGNGHTTQGSIQHVSDQLGQTKAALNTVVKKDIPALKSEAGCEHRRADVNGDLATKPVIINPSAVQPDNCPHPRIVVPSVPAK